MAEEEIAQKNILEYQKTVAELCRKVAEDPKRYTAYVMQDELPCLIPVDGVLAVVDAAHKREIDEMRRIHFEVREAELSTRNKMLDEKDNEIKSLRALVKELADAVENEIGKIEPNYDFIDSIVAKAREACK